MVVKVRLVTLAPVTRLLSAELREIFRDAVVLLWRE